MASHFVCISDIHVLTMAETHLAFIAITAKCNILTCECINFLDKVCTENMRHAYRGTVNASGHARALEAASLLTKKHGRRNKKSLNC